MEFLVYSMCAGSIGLALFKPKFEKLAFSLLLVSAVLGGALYLIGASGSILPAVNL